MIEQAATAAPASPQTSEPCRPVSIVADSGPFSWPTVVFFDRGSAALTSRSKLILDDFNKKVVNTRLREFAIIAHTDSSESDVGRLDYKRAEAVRDYLVNARVAADSMFLKTLGDTQPLVQTRQGAAEPQNRYVELRPLGSYNSDYGQLAHRTLLCRRWLLDHCIGTSQSASATVCKAGINFLIRGDVVSQDLDWRTTFVP